MIPALCLIRAPRLGAAQKQMPFEPHARILVADDDVRVLCLIREVIAALLPECAIETTTDPEYAFELVLRRQYDLLILDFAMGAIDGASLYSLVAKVFTIHPLPSRSMPPMLLMTGFASQPRARELLRRPGVRGLLAKPFSIEQLVEQVARELRLGVCL